MRTAPARSGRLRHSLLAGGFAIIVNTLALKAADLVPLATARGGLLRLVRPWVASPLEALGIAEVWTKVGGPDPASPAFATGFHLAVGLLMAVFYVYAVEPIVRGKAWFKGLVYAAGVWLLNAAVVLPATGEGFAGSAHLTGAGMLWFAAAHTLFFVLLALTYARCVRISRRLTK